MTKEVKQKKEATAVAAKPTKVEKVIANGVSRPHAHTKCGAIWAVADEISAKHQRPAMKQEVLDECTAKGYNLGNSKDEYSRWKRFNGLTRKAAQKVTETAPEAATA